MTEMESIKESLLVIQCVVNSLIDKIEKSNRPNSPDKPTKKEIERRKFEERKRYYRNRILNHTRG
jgi:hypothetical protein